MNRERLYIKPICINNIAQNAALFCVKQLVNLLKFINFNLILKDLWRRIHGQHRLLAQISRRSFRANPGPVWPRVGDYHKEIRKGTLDRHRDAEHTINVKIKKQEQFMTSPLPIQIPEG